MAPPTFGDRELPRTKKIAYSLQPAREPETNRQGEGDRYGDLFSLLLAKIGAVVIPVNVQGNAIISLVVEEGIECTQYIGLAGVVQAREGRKITKVFDLA